MDEGIIENCQARGLDHATPKLLIESEVGWAPLNLLELWHYRELLLFLAWRDITVRYKQTTVGILWAILQPTLMMLAFSLFLGRLAKVPSDGVPYPIFAYAAMLPWQLFATAVSSAALSVVSNSNLLLKVYVPRLIIPIASMIPATVDFAIAFLLLIFLMMFYKVGLSWKLLYLPVFTLFALSVAMGIGLWLSALVAQYRDFRYVVPFMLQFWMMVSPVAYPSSIVPSEWQVVYGLNPMCGVIDGFRWVLFSTGRCPEVTTVVSLLVTIVVLVTGAYYFTRIEGTLADRI